MMTPSFAEPCRRLALALVIAVLAAVAALPALAQDKSTPAAGQVSPADKKALEAIIHDYIMKNPEVIMESIQAMRARQEAAARKQAATNLAVLRNDLMHDPATPVAGNPKGDVTIVEFFDYRCAYCKKVFPDILKVLNGDRNVRYVFKEFPILGPDSVIATRASLAVWLTQPEHYFAFHRALMGATGSLPEAKVLSLAKDVGLDAAKLKKAMADKRIDTMIANNHALAEALNISGTPAFIIGDHIIRGAIDVGQIKQLVMVARGS